MKRLWMLLAAAAMFAGAEASAEPFACPATGTVVRISLGHAFKFTGSQNGICDMYMIEKPPTETSLGAVGYVRGLWPLRPGENNVEAVLAMERLDTDALGDGVSFTERYGSGPDETVKTTLSVVRREKVTVPAGVFDTAVVRARIAMSRPGRDGNAQVFEREYTYWYAPSVGFYVKRDVKIQKDDPFLRPDPWVAVKVRIPK